MPTVLRQAGFRFVIYQPDHDPPHVHAYHGEGEAKIALCPVKVMDHFGMSQPVLAKARRLAHEYQRFLIEEWRRRNG